MYFYLSKIVLVDNEKCLLLAFLARNISLKIIIKINKTNSKHK